MASLNLTSGLHLDRVAQIASLFSKEVKITDEYSDFANVFSKEKTLVLLECIQLNQHAINLDDGKQFPNRLIYSLGPVELEILKTYIKAHLKIRFIRPFKSLSGALILFYKKPDSCFRLCIHYQGLNNLTIKNQYLLFLIEKFLDRLGQAKRFIQLDLTSVFQ